MVTNVLHAGSSELSPGTQYLGPNWKSLPTYLSLYTLSSTSGALGHTSLEHREYAFSGSFSQNIVTSRARMVAKSSRTNTRKQVNIPPVSEASPLDIVIPGDLFQDLVSVLEPLRLEPHSSQYLKQALDDLDSTADANIYLSCSWTNAGPQIAALKRLGKTLNQNSRKLISGSWLVLTLVAQCLYDSLPWNVWRSQEFSPNDSMEMFATIGGACAAGTASVVLAGALLAGIPMISGPLMAAASAGGTTYGNWGADARLCNARVPIALEI
ncbi:hypothetical protein EDB19DRAFT_1826924 [Suillus lakei]|nr:hypothetical protein EDB19DRAFT_1826924 [Suillus lakei]